MTVEISCDHIQFVVEDAAMTAQRLVTRFGFEVVRPASPNNQTVVLSQGSIVVLLTEPQASGRDRDFLTAHGEGVARIGFSCSDVREAYARAVAHGTPAIEAPRTVAGTLVATVGGVGDTTHTLVEQSPTTTTPFLPEVGRVNLSRAMSPVGLRSIDHLAICVPAGQLTETATRYRLAWGFDEIFRETIAVGSQAMNSLVVASPRRSVILTLIEPAGSTPGQIDLFLRRHGGAGIQHAALNTSDIVESVSRLRSRGVEFAGTADAYYSDLPARLGRLRHRPEHLRALGILVDRDHDGDLYQIFAKSTHERGTYFFEVVERDGARTFGSNNVKFLFQSKERELAARVPPS